MSTVSEQGLIHRVQAIRLATGELRQWLAGGTMTDINEKVRRELKSSIDEIELNLDKLEADPAVLTVVFLGGTGVGKSTILNSLARARIAPSTVKRPTTQYSTVYHHVDVDLSALPEPFRRCRCVSHERPELRQKILIDTPDIDGTVQEHHERLKEILPVADAVLYIGSAEKYHDRAAWSLLLEHASTRGFAFILNKWDRCLAAYDESTGRPPDEDLRQSLKEAGFPFPRLFRLCAKQWEMSRADGKEVPETISDDFELLEKWLESELDERTVRDIKSRGISRELQRLIAIVERVLPPDWTKKEEKLAAAWREALRINISDQTSLLIESTDGQSRDLERHFSRLGREGIGGLFGIYLHLVDRLMHLRGALLPIPTGEKKKTEIQRIAAKCIASIPSTIRNTHREAIRDRLLNLADREGWSIDVLGKELATEGQGGPSSELGDGELAGVLTAELRTLEKDYEDPRGSKRAIHAIVRSLCTWIPVVVLVAIGVSLIYKMVTLNFPGVGEFFSAVLLFAMTIAAMHLLLTWVFPVKWVALREKLRDRLEFGLIEQLAPGYMRTLDDYTTRMKAERELLLGVLAVMKGVRDQLVRSVGETTTSLFSEKSDRP